MSWTSESSSRFQGLLLLACILALPAWAQRFGGNPSSMRWEQINTDTVRVIFPRGLEASGRRVADIAHYLNRTTGSTIGDSRKKISIVLQNQTTFSNAYVGLAPWRSEFYLTPFQNSLELGSLPWVDNLAIHEYRHVQQYMNFRKGLSKFAWWVAGEEGQSLANAVAVPDWFFEGDAVYQETSVSGQGRGRLPNFYNGYRSLWEAGRKYNYMQLRNGSYRRFMPDHYELGYLLVAYGRYKYGEDFWRKVTGDAIRFKPLFYPFQKNILRYSGQNFKSFVTDAFEFYKKDSILAEPSTKARPLSKPETHDVQEYHFPILIGKDSLLYLRNSFRYLSAWYLRTAGKDQKIRVKDIGLEDYYTYRNGKIIYTAFETDPRWSWKDYSNIRILDLESGEQKRLTRKGKYFSPELSHNGKSVIAAEVLPDGLYRLVLLDAQNGNPIREYTNPENYYFTYPRFRPADRSVVTAVRNNRGEMSLAELELSTGQFSFLLPFTKQVIAYPSLKGDSIFFSASFDGRDRILMLANGHLFQLVSKYTGAYGASMEPGADSLIYSQFTADGRMMNKSGIDQIKEIPLGEWALGDLYNRVESTLAKLGGDQLESIPNGHYEKSAYHTFSHPFNFHSWRPYYDQPEWSFTFYGENVLNTFLSELYYLYNENEQSHKIGYNGAYAGLYPWITGGLSYTFSRSFEDTSGQILWDELNANAGFRLPFNFSSGRSYKYLTLAGSFNLEQRNFKGASKDLYENQRFPYLEGSVTWSWQIQQALQHIYPRLAHTVFLRYRYLNDRYSARQFLGMVNLYLPGLSVTHNLVLQGAYQTRDDNREYFFDNSFPFARGYPSVDLPYMWKAGVNYHFPIIYPDWGFAQIVYFLRIRANVYFDNAWVRQQNAGSLISLRSTGIEVFFDTRWWNQQPVSFGIRYSRLLDADKYSRPPAANQWTFILPVNLLR